jgi:hypothetical protein
VIHKFRKDGVRCHICWTRATSLENAFESLLVVDRSRLGVFEDFVGILGLLEFVMGFFSFGFRDFVGVVGKRKLLVSVCFLVEGGNFVVGLFDFAWGCCGADAQLFIQGSV